MSKPEEKQIYRIIAQKEGITITAETANEVTFEEDKEIAKSELQLDEINKTVEFEPFVVLPITTQERWEDKTINFCPRCGTNLNDYEFEQYASFDCDNCDTAMEIHIAAFDFDDED